MSLNPSIRKVVPPTPPSAIASYDYSDIADGTGVKNFYACQSIASGAYGTAYYLTTDTSIISGRVAEKLQNKSGLVSDMNYDVVFNLPKIIKGNVRISLGQGVSGDTVSVTLRLSLYKISDGVTTQIGNSVDTDKTTQTGAGQTSHTRNLTIDTSERIHFKIGDTLRLNVKMYGQVGVAPNTMGYGCDPAGTTDAVDSCGAIVIVAPDPTKLTVGIPFIIDI